MNSKKKYPNKSTGFLLIELVIALAIFAIFIKAIFNLQVNILISQKQMQKHICVLEDASRSHETHGDSEAITNSISEPVTNREHHV